MRGPVALSLGVILVKVRPQHAAFAVATADRTDQFSAHVRLAPFWLDVYTEGMHTTMVVPDLQVPLHDAEFVQKLIDVADYLKPDALAFVGDLTDSTEAGRWVKGAAGEYAGQLQAAFDQTAEIVSKFRRAVGPSCEMTIVNSNHDERLRKYVAENAPALSSLRSLDFARLTGLDEAGVQLIAGPYHLTPDTVIVHGHERASSSVPGKYGLDRARDYGANVIYGHTHTPVLVTSAVGVGESRVNRWGMNVGHGMDMTKAGYLKDGYATWGQAFGIVDWDGAQSHPQLVVAVNGTFSFCGEIW